MEAREWLVSKDVIAKSKKAYAHFDWRTDIGQQREYISVPENISHHAFYPFIHYQQKIVKYQKDVGKKPPKVRDICYAAHIDRCIFQFYSFQLNNLYNERVKRDGIDGVAIAYRTDLGGSNITFSKQAFDFIRRNAPCYVMIGDFTGFFDNLDHQYLKRQWCLLLDERFLPEDHYAVFRNVTHYSKWERSDLLKLNGLPDTKEGVKLLNKKSAVLTKEQFQQNRSHIITHPDPFGIPQGSPISAVLANVYMLEVDKKINDMVRAVGGMYMRYSDDFIVVLPEQQEGDSAKALEQVVALVQETPRLELQPSKTQYFHFANNTLVNCGNRFHADADCSKRFINFLGFTFDGNKISIRSKTTGKYYYRMYRKARGIVKQGGYTPEGKHISGKKLYETYSKKGAKNGRGNFLTYVERAADVYGKNEDVGRDTARHMQKIRKALKSK
jgi:hypothetical protein